MEALCLGPPNLLSLDLSALGQHPQHEGPLEPPPSSSRFRPAGSSAGGNGSTRETETTVKPKHVVGLARALRLLDVLTLTGARDRLISFAVLRDLPSHLRVLDG